MRKLVLGLAVVGAAGVAMLAGEARQAQATFPGANGTIVFDSGRAGTGTGNLFTMRPDGNDVRQLTFYSAAQGQAGPQAWSPDGRQLVYVFNQALYLINADGSNQRLLLSEPGFAELWPSFSPDGRRVIFSRCLPDFKACAIYSVKTDGQRLDPITRFNADRNVFDLTPKYSPDGQTIVFSSLNRDGVTGSIYLMNANGGNIRNLTPPALEGFEPDWSPDGGSIAFVSDCCGTEPSEVWTVRRDGSNLKRLTAPPTHNLDPSYSPQGDKIAFTSFSADFSTVSIVTMNRDGTDQTTIQSGPDAEAFALGPVWGTAR